MRSAEVKTEVVFAMDLLAQLRGGRLRIPGFQRPYVWNHEKVRRLLDSILRGFPIGSIFVWETSTRPRNLPKVGPVAVEVDQPASPTPVGYLLDGHQRLATLMGTLAATEDELDSAADSRFRVFFNMETNEFEHAAKERPELFPMWRLMDTSRFLDQCERLRQQAQRAVVADWVTKAKNLVDTFQRCAIGVTRVQNKDLKDAVEAFTRLNREGQAMTPDQIFLALAYSEETFNLSTELDSLIEEVLKPWRYNDISRTALLRVVLAALNRDIYTPAEDWPDLLKEVQGQLPVRLAECRKSTNLALEFLHQRIGASSQKALPYSLQLVLFGEFFRSLKGARPTAEQLALMERWFWVSSFTSAFMIGSSAKFNNAAGAAREIGSTGKAPDWLDLGAPALAQPTDFHPRAARVRAFFLFLKHLRPLDPGTGQPLSQILDDGFGDALLVMNTEKPELRRNLANRVLLGSRFRGQPALAFQRLGLLDDEVRQQILSSHAISQAAWQCLCKGDVEGFVQARGEALVEAELRFLESKGVAAPRAVAAQADLPDEGDD